MPHFLMGMQTPLKVTEAAATLARPAAETTVDHVEIGFQAMPTRVAPGQQVWEVNNVCEQIHELLIMRFIVS